VDPVEAFLLAIAGVFAIGVAGEVVFRRTGIPDVIWLVLVGMILGPITGAVPRERLTEVAPYFAALTLVIILFDGGVRLRIRDLSQAAPRSGLLALASFTASALVVMAASMVARAVGLLPSSWTLQHGVMLGAILGGSSSIIIMPAMAQAGVKAGVANLLSLESAFTDALCVVGTVAMVRYMDPAASGGSPVLEIVIAFAVGLFVGALIGAAWVVVTRIFPLGTHGYPVILAVLLGMYVAVENLGGSAALAILAFAVVVGNADAVAPPAGDDDAEKGEVSLRGVHAQIAFIMKSFFFTFIGAMLGPPWSAVTLGVVLGLLLLVARWPAVRLAGLGTDYQPAEQRMIFIGFPRGLAAGVLATLPFAAGIPGTERLATIVFACVPTTVFVFAVGFAFARRQMGPLPDEGVEAPEHVEPDTGGPGD